MVRSTKNRMASQKPDSSGKLPYSSTFQTIGKVARSEGVLTLWNGFTPYYGRCGGHTVFMFVWVDVLRNAYSSRHEIL